MRQAGRILKPYRDLKEKRSGSIRDLFEAPELAAEITLMPVSLLDVDAAILFADIFTPVMPMGCHVEFSPGPQLASPIRNERQVESLRTIEPQSDLPHVLETIALAKHELKPAVPLIGFAGAPFTLATYMAEGAGAREFTQFRRMVQAAPNTAHSLLSKLTDSTIAYLSAQIKAGAQAIQLFDTCVGALSAAAFSTVALPYLQQIFASLAHFDVPRIYYANGASHLYAHLARVGADVLSLDWRTELAAVFHRFEGAFAVQGNLDPIVLFGSPEHIEGHARDLLTATDGIPHIFNLGHGVHPETPFDSVRWLVDVVHEYESPN